MNPELEPGPNLSNETALVRWLLLVYHLLIQHGEISLPWGLPTTAIAPTNHFKLIFQAVKSSFKNGHMLEIIISASAAVGHVLISHGRLE